MKSEYESFEMDEVMIPPNFFEELITIEKQYSAKKDNQTGCDIT